MTDNVRLSEFPIMAVVSRLLGARLPYTMVGVGAARILASTKGNIFKVRSFIIVIVYGCNSTFSCALL
jgi:hypothetical protein